ncbi:MAG: cyclic nucleotide-binding domain-containing protein [Tsuneonella sp.]
MQAAQVFLQLTCVLLVAAMLMNSLRTLRMLALAAGLSAVLYFALSGRAGSTLIWASLFVLANGVQLARLLIGSRLSKMRPEERELLEDILRVDDPAKQRRLLGLLSWRDAPVGEVLIKQGQTRPPLIYVASGAAGIEVDGRLVGVCGEGDFLGDMSIATGEPASAAVVVTNPMRIAVVDRGALTQLAQAAPEVGAAFDGALNRGLAAKILRMNQAAAGA